MGFAERFSKWKRDREVSKERSQLDSYQKDRAAAAKARAEANRLERSERGRSEREREEGRVKTLKARRFQRRTEGARKVVGAVRNFLSTETPRRGRRSRSRGRGRVRRSRKDKSSLGSILFD